MTILYPWIFWGFLGIIPLVLVLSFQYQRSKRFVSILSRNWKSGSVETLYFFKWFVQSLLLIGFYISMIFALAGISWGDQPVEEDRSSLDITFLVDVSRSMLAIDHNPSRLEGAMEYILGMVQEFNQARFSLLAFSGNAVQLVPLTENTISLEFALQALSPGIITAPGTNIERALQRAIQWMPQGSDRNRILVLLTDGEALDGTVESIAPRFHRQGIPILSIGFGTPQGSPIPLDDARNLRHPQTGEVVITRLDTQTLDRIAELSSGVVFLASEPGSFSRVVNWVGNFETTRGIEGFRLVSVQRYGVFLLFALGFLGLYIIFRSWKLRGVL
jgi:Ca-activated chloride channel family protein